MSTLRDDLLDDIDDIRSIPGELGLHLFRVYVRVTTFSSATPGRSAGTVVETELLVNGQPPHVRELRMRDVIAGGGEFKATLYEIGPLTPEITPDTVLDPTYSGQTTTMQYRITGRALPDGGVLCQRVDDDTFQPFRSMIRVRTIGRTGRAP